MDTSISYSQQIFKAQFDKSTVNSTRKMTFIVAAESTGREHRNKYLYNWDNWKIDSYNQNGIIGYQHNVYGDNMCVPDNPDNIIGKSTVGIDKFEGKRAIVADAEFEPGEINPTAEKVFQKIKWGSLNATSVGVLPVGSVKSETVRNDNNEIVDVFWNLSGQELVEWSIVHIPADKKALRKSMKNHTMAALSFVQTLMEDLSLSDIKNMRVQEILDAIENKYVGAPLEKIQKELSGSDPNLDLYISKLTMIKNGSLKKS